jgi:membrane protein YdbS with pleckstrin-like domain
MQARYMSRPHRIAERERVPFPDDVLTAEEDVVLHLHPHAKAAVRPVLVLLLALAATIVAWVMLPVNDGGRIGVLVVGGVSGYFALRHGVWPLLVWRCTHYVLTDERILLQDGVIARERRDLPLARVNDHAMSQSLLDRLFGCGTLTVDSIGDQAAVLASVPHVQRVQTTLYELIEADRDRHADDEDDDEVEEEPEIPAPRGLGRLRRRAKGCSARRAASSSEASSASRSSCGALSSARPAATSISAIAASWPSTGGLRKTNVRYAQKRKIVATPAAVSVTTMSRSAWSRSLKPAPYLAIATEPDWITMPTRLKPKNSVYSRRSAVLVWCRYVQ